MAWRATTPTPKAITRAPVPHEGCFEASFPDSDWVAVECVKAPDKAYAQPPRLDARSASPELVGNGNDYAASSAGKISGAVGTFPVVTGVKKESGGGAANSYSIQLNSNFMSTAACDGHANCQSWEQFVYSTDEQSAFMQYWLINYGATCPSSQW